MGIEIGIPRKARIEPSGALQHITVRGIERKEIFLDDADRDAFLQILGQVLVETHKDCFAWALLLYHGHFLLRTGFAP